MFHMMLPGGLENTGRRTFDDIFDQFEAREFARRIMRIYINGIVSDIDREIALWLHSDRISKQATNEDIVATLESIDMQEVESLYGSRVRMAADRGRTQGNHSALRCFVREVRRVRRDMMTVATYGR
jgi:hypothetical protein